MHTKYNILASYEEFFSPKFIFFFFFFFLGGGGGEVGNPCASIVGESGVS